MRCPVVLVSALALTAACSDDAVTDAGSEDSAVDAADGALVIPPAPTAPTPPALPDMTPCPDGFTEVEVGETVSFTLCEPAPAEDCPAGEYLFNEGCRPVGAPCPAGTFANATTIDSPIYVDPSAAAGGDGSEAAPHQTIADALAAAVEGDTLMLAAGEHEGAVTLDRSLTLQGACPGATTVTAPADGPAIVTSGDDVVLRDLRISGDGFGIRIGAGSTTLSGVVIDATQNVALVAQADAMLFADDIAIVDTRPVDGELGMGIIALNGARVSAEHVSLVRNATFSVGANAGATVELSDARISQTLAATVNDLGVAISAINGSSVTCDRCAIDRALGVGVDAAGAGSSVTLVDSRIDEMLQSAEEDAGFAALARGEGAIILTRTAVTRSQLGGVVASAGASVTLTDVLIHDALHQVGYAAYARTTTTAERFAISQARGVAFHFADPGATGSLSDLTVVDTRARTDGLGGRGMELGFGVDLTLERARLENNVEVAILAEEESTVTATDLLIRDTQPRRGVGRAINLQGASTLDAERLEISNNSEVGIFLYDVGTNATLRSLRITETQARDCPDGSCPAGSGIGIVLLDDAALTASDFLLARNALAGLQVADADVTWTDGVVRDHPIGVNVQFRTIDPGALTENVIYIDNGQNLDATDLPVPAPTMSSTR